MLKQADTPNAPALSTAAERAALRRALVGWFRRNRRDLPWRDSRDPYAIWVSEVMLQQTQVATVVPYFERFLRAFPSIRRLADADEQQVLRLWEGLGYYRRARQMHRAARVIRDVHRGQFPRELAAIAALPGIGRYTAGAIRSIAFDLPAPILEANTVRLFSRLVGYAADVSSTAGRTYLWQVAESLLPARGCGSFNQALMELGSLVCTPRAPECTRCPLARWCVAKRAGSESRIPRKTGKPKPTPVSELAVVVRRRKQVLLRQREPGERWAGLWDFLRFEPPKGAAMPLTAKTIAREVARRFQLHLDEVAPLATIKHTVTRFRITLACFTATTRSRPTSGGTWRWVRTSDLADYPLSSTGRRLARLIAERADGEGRTGR